MSGLEKDGEAVMGKASKTELSKRSVYWIPKARYHELRYFCLQFDEWLRAVVALDGLATRECRDPTEREALERLRFENKIKMVEDSAKKAGFELAPWLIIGVTTGKSYDTISASNRIPCCREVYYTMYRRFFWLLDKIRD